MLSHIVIISTYPILRFNAESSPHSRRTQGKYLSLVQPLLPKMRNRTNRDSSLRSARDTMARASSTFSCIKGGSRALAHAQIAVGADIDAV